MAKNSKNVSVYFSHKEYEELDDFISEMRKLTPKPNKSDVLRVGFQVVKNMKPDELVSHLQHLSEYENS